MQHIFASLTSAIEGSAAVALSAAFVWGILSVVLSPCHLASIPLVIAYITKQGEVGAKRAFALSLTFGIGILATIAALGAITAALGRMAGDIGAAGSYLVAGIFILMGLILLDALRIPSFENRMLSPRSGLFGAFALGLIFGIALGPCTFAFMAPVMAVSFKTAGANPAFAVALLALYALGHCAVIVAAGTSAEAVQRYLNWNERSNGAIILRKICGALLILCGLYLIYKAV